MIRSVIQEIDVAFHAILAIRYHFDVAVSKDHLVFSGYVASQSEVNIGYSRISAIPFIHNCHFCDFSGANLTKLFTGNFFKRRTHTQLVADTLVSFVVSNAACDLRRAGLSKPSGSVCTSENQSGNYSN